MGERPRGRRGRRGRSSGHTAAAPCGPAEAHGGAGRPSAAHAVGREGRGSCSRGDPCGVVPEGWAQRYGAVLGRCWESCRVWEGHVGSVAKDGVVRGTHVEQGQRVTVEDLQGQSVTSSCRRR